MADWPAIKSAYIKGRLSVKALCLEFHISAGSLYRKINDEGWPKRSNKRKSQSKKKRRHNQDPAQQTITKKTAPIKALDDAHLLNRMMTMIEKQLSKLEEKIDLDEGDGSANARHLSSLAQAYRQLSNLKIKSLDPVSGKTRDDLLKMTELLEGEGDAEILRARLQERLRRFKKRRD